MNGLGGAGPDGLIPLPGDTGGAVLPVSILTNDISGTGSLEVLYAGGVAGLVIGAMQVNFRLASAGPPGSLETQLFYTLQVGEAVSSQFGIYISQ